MVIVFYSASKNYTKQYESSVSPELYGISSFVAGSEGRSAFHQEVALSSKTSAL